MKRILLFLFVILLVPSMVFTQDKMSFRESLLSSEALVGLWPIDQYHTFILPITGSNHVTSDKFMSDFVIRAKELGGVIEKLSKDPISGEETLWSEFEGDGGVNYRFIIFDTKRVRIRGVGQVVYDHFERLENMMRNMPPWKSDKGFVFKHDSPQPFVFKSSVFDNNEEVPVIKDGELKEACPAVIGKKPGAEEKKGFFGKLFSVENNYRIPDVFLLFQRLSAASGGKLRYVINKAERIEDPNGPIIGITNSSDRIGYLIENTSGKRYRSEAPSQKEVDAATAFIFALLKGTPWFVSSEGDRSFIAAGKPGKEGRLSVYFANNRNLSSIKFVPMQ